MRTVGEVSRITGISVRTLHHYDAIGLLKPSKVNEAGYRFYDDRALEKIGMILLFKELKFSLEEIKMFLEVPDIDLTEILSDQIALLELEYNRLGELITFAKELKEKGLKGMDFNKFDKTEIEEYKEEARKKWSNTSAYKEYSKKNSKRTDVENEVITQDFMKIFSDLGDHKDKNPSSSEVQEKIKELQNFITDHYYYCSDSILADLGKMYVEDSRFQRNIDKIGGEGTAALVSEAISFFVNNN